MPIKIAQWVETAERQPSKYGRYKVISGRNEGEYLWNGAYWVTPKGSPTKAVRMWLDEEVDPHDK